MDVNEDVKTRQAKLIDITTIKPDDFEELFKGIIPTGWMELLQYYYEEIGAVGRVLRRQVLEKGQRIVPEPWNIFRCLQLTPWWDVKVVIIGQDPYYATYGADCAATGCCFECKPHLPIQHSLDQVLTRLIRTVPGFKKPVNGDLSKWAAQGVLLLNAALTTDGSRGKEGAGAHLDIWAFFPKRILEFLSKKHKNLVYMAWGKKAQYYLKFVKGDNLFLQCSHPAAQGKSNNFREMDHFNEANKYLREHNLGEIDWRL